MCLLLLHGLRREGSSDVPAKSKPHTALERKVRLVLDTLFKRGTVVTDMLSAEIDVGIAGGKIVALGDASYMGDAIRVIDATGKFVLPGGIDTHTHFESPSFMGALPQTDFAQGTRAAAVGGTTTIIDFAYQQKSELPQQGLIRRRLQADGHVAIDYSLHMIMIDLSQRVLESLPELIEEGVPSFKVYMVYRNEGLMADDAVLFELLKVSAKHGALVGAHAESISLTEHNVAEAIARGHRAPIYHSLTKPSLVEEEAVNRALFLARRADAPYFNFHTASGTALELIEKERTHGRPVFAETCPHYLVLDDSCLERDDGCKFVCSPPLRKRTDIDILWNGITKGSIVAIGSDDASYSYKDKMRFDSFHTIPNGLNGAEYLRPVLYSEGVTKGRMSIEQFVSVTSSLPAKIMGLYPKKGTIAPGSDADIVLWDPDMKIHVSHKTGPRDIDWTPYEGMTLTGAPALTMLRGEVIAEHFKFVGKPNRGEFVKRVITL